MSQPMTKGAVSGRKERRTGKEEYRYFAGLAQWFWRMGGEDFTWHRDHRTTGERHKDEGR